MKTNYFLVTESDDSVVGVISATCNEELNTKLEIALREHFDYYVEKIPPLDLENYLYGRVGEFEVTVNDDDEVNYTQTIYIQSVELY